MDDLKLVQLVRQYGCLYDKSNKDFKSVSKKKAAWQRIAREIGMDERMCLRRWTYMRERFTKENRRLTALANNGVTTPNLWPLFNELTFLRQHIIPRINRQKWTFTSEGKVEYNAETSMGEHEDTELYECVTEPFQFKSSSSFMSDPETLEEEVEVFIPNHTRPSSAIKAQIQTPKTPYHEQQNSNTKHNYESNAAVRGFGQMIVETICGMSERKQAIAMQKVTELVMNIKLEPES